MMCVWRSYSHYDDIRITPLWILNGAHQVGVGFQSKLRLTHKSDLFPLAAVSLQIFLAAPMSGPLLEVSLELLLCGFLTAHNKLVLVSKVN